MRNPVEAFQEQKFSTTEAASILEMPIETLRTQLKRGLPVAEDREPGQWRSLSIDDLLRIRITLTLGQGLPMAQASEVVREKAPTFFGRELFLVQPLRPNGKFHAEDARMCGVAEIGEVMSDSIGRPSQKTGERVNRSIVVYLSSERQWLRERIDKFYLSET